MKVTAIVCTLDERKVLPETISSIKRSPLVNELIIVGGEFKPIGYARDVGWRKAQNPIICFINDEVVLQKPYCVCLPS